MQERASEPRGIEIPQSSVPPLLWQVKALGCLWLWLRLGAIRVRKRTRHTYEKSGLELFPAARYFKKLGSADVLISRSHSILQLNAIARSIRRNRF